MIGPGRLDPTVAAAADAGEPVVLSGHGPVVQAFEEMAERIITDIAPLVEMTGCTARLLDRIESALGPTG